MQTILIIENIDLYSAFEEICPIYTTLTMGNEADDPGTGSARQLDGHYSWILVREGDTWKIRGKLATRIQVY